MISLSSLSFTPTPDVAALLHILLDVYERRGGTPPQQTRHKRKQAVRVNLDDVSGTLPSYYNQTNPTPRTTANEQLAQLQERGLLRLIWQPGQTGHLLDALTLESDGVEELYALLEREPLSERRRRLRATLLRSEEHTSELQSR